jgi:hypothetical protein
LSNLIKSFFGLNVGVTSYFTNYTPNRAILGTEGRARSYFLSP